ncbi:MAG: hypothetical protein GOV01_03455 [Candidatus Altiarchaeota archaeon]|nr:hypothetical protein [Candidatus Altiarchaeota archaeon]
MDIPQDVVDAFKYLSTGEGPIESTLQVDNEGNQHDVFFFPESYDEQIRDFVKAPFIQIAQGATNYSGNPEAFLADRSNTYFNNIVDFVRNDLGEAHLEQDLVIYSNNQQATVTHGINGHGQTSLQLSIYRRETSFDDARVFCRDGKEIREVKQIPYQDLFEVAKGI